MSEEVSLVSPAIHKSAGTRSEHTERFYLPELDVLRFFAFFAVFLCHVAPDGPAFYDSHGALGRLGASGAFGVDLFFTLSGYLLTSLLLREREQSGDVNLRAFYARRTLRIWPLYYFSLALAFLLTRIPESIIAAPPLLGDLFAPIRPISYFYMAIFLFNFNFANSLGTNRTLFMTHLWSISVEACRRLRYRLALRAAPCKRHRRDLHSRDACAHRVRRAERRRTQIACRLSQASLMSMRRGALRARLRVAMRRNFPRRAAVGSLRSKV